MDTTSSAAVVNGQECKVVEWEWDEVQPSEVDVPVKLLLVEDLPQLQGVVLDLLATVGDFELVKVVATEAEANLWLEENPGTWDLAVIDLILEQGTGLGVISRARHRADGSKVVVFSDYATEGIRKHCIRLGADAVFQKGDDLKAFLDFCGALARPGTSS